MPPVSPCTKICEIDSGNGLCRGCGRSLSEIADWSRMSDADKYKLLAALVERQRAGGSTDV